MQPTLANILGRKLLVSGTTSGTFLDSQPKKFPRMHSEYVLPGDLAKDNLPDNLPDEASPGINHLKQCKLAAIFVLSSNNCITSTHNAYFAEFIMQMPGKCRMPNFYHLMLLKISKLIKLLLKNICL